VNTHRILHPQVLDSSRPCRRVRPGGCDTTGTGYGIAVFDLDPGLAGDRTTITVGYYHAPGADKTPTADYELFEQIILAKNRRGSDREGRE
jgi:hypothetical protein